MKARLLACVLSVLLVGSALGSDLGEWLRRAARVSDLGNTEWSVVVTTGHFGGDPELASATRRKLVEIFSEVGAKGDRVRIYTAEMKLWGESREVNIESLEPNLPTTQAPNSRGGTDIEAVLLQVAPLAKGPVIVVSPGNSVMPLDGSGSLVGGDGSVPGFEKPERLKVAVQTPAKERSICLTVLSRSGFFKGTKPRVPVIAPSLSLSDSPSPSLNFGAKSTPEQESPKYLQVFYTMFAFIAGVGIGWFVGRQRPPTTDMTIESAEPTSRSDSDEVNVWKENAKQLQRRLDLISQEIELSMQRASQESEVQLVQSRQEVSRLKTQLAASDSLLIDFVDGICRAMDHPNISTEASTIWNRARSQILHMAQRLGLDEIRPLPGDTYIGSFHKIESVVPPSNEFPSGVVIQLVEPGYRRAEAVIRQAKVVIALEVK